MSNIQQLKSQIFFSGDQNRDDICNVTENTPLNDMSAACEMNQMLANPLIWYGGCVCFNLFLPSNDHC